jgi:short-subunit dehydrogenase
VLVNNAGRGLLGAVEETTDAEARAVFDTMCSAC